MSCIYSSQYLLASLWMSLVQCICHSIEYCEFCVSVAAVLYCIVPLATRNVDITSDTTRRALVSMRQTRKEIVQRTGRTAHLHTAMPICASLCMTCVRSMEALVCRLSWKLHFLRVWSLIVSWMKIRSGMVSLLSILRLVGNLDLLCLHKRVSKFLLKSREPIIVLISISIALSQTAALSLCCESMDMELLHCMVCLFTPSFCWYLLHLSTEGWSGWVWFGSWLHTKMVYPPTDSYTSQH